MIGTVILQSNVVGIRHLQFRKQFIKRRRSCVLLVLNRTGSEHFHYHCKVLFIFGCFIMKIKYKCKQKHWSRGIPKGVLWLTSFRSGTLKKVRHELLHIVVILQIDKRVIAMAFLHWNQIENTDFIAFAFKQLSGISENFALWVKNDKWCVALHKIRLAVKPCLTGSRTAAHKGV